MLRLMLWRSKYSGWHAIECGEKSAPRLRSGAWLLAALKLENSNYSIIHRNEKQMFHVDALIRWWRRGTPQRGTYNLFDKPQTL